LNNNDGNESNEGNDGKTNDMCPKRAIECKTTEKSRIDDFLLQELNALKKQAISVNMNQKDWKHHIN
jgi:hypothetical protein